MFNYYYDRERAQKRMDGEDVFGQKISVGHPGQFPLHQIGNTPVLTRMQGELHKESPSKSFRKSKRSSEMDEGYQTMASATSWGPWCAAPLQPQYNKGASAIWTNSDTQSSSRPFMGLNSQDNVFHGSAYRPEQRSASPVTSPMVVPNTRAPMVWPWELPSKEDRSQSNKRRTAGFVQKTPDLIESIDTMGDMRPMATAIPTPRVNPYMLPRSRTPNLVYGSSANVMNGRRSRTPSPWQLHNSGHLPANLNSSDDSENYFQPIHKVSSNVPVELQVCNLDQNIDPLVMRKTLASVFREHVQVISVSVFMQSDGNIAATVKVPSLQDAQYAISQLHRRRVGYKRLLISYVQSGGPDLQLLRSQIVTLLQGIPGHSVPLFKFRELFESRYLVSVSMSELYRMRDVCIISEDPNGRTVALHPDHRDTPSPCLAYGTEGSMHEFPFCQIHCKLRLGKGWAEQELDALPNVRIGLPELTTNLHSLLNSHQGLLPLPSLAMCYEAELGVVLTVDESGVPLEHLASCVEGITIKQSMNSVKHLVWSTRKTIDHNDSIYSHTEDSITGAGVKSVSPPLASQLALFSRELVDLLRTNPKCQLLFNKFVPAYHHHFGRQCRVADYGFTKLIELMEALGHIIQVMGDGNKRTITLSHRAQIRRFTSDLLRVLKTQASKQMLLSDLPDQFEKTLGRPFDIVEYGVCDIEDMLNEVNESSVVVMQVLSDKIVQIPKREQTAEEVERTRQFSIEVVELLRHAPQSTMLFNKFVPAYHHHFGHQCRVSDYGFTKLIELFESISDIVKIEDGADGDRRVSLTPQEGLKVLAEQLELILSAAPRNGMALNVVTGEFLKQFGYALKPEVFDCTSMVQLLGKIARVNVVQNANGVFVSLEDRAALRRQGLRAWSLLLVSYKMKLGNFLEKYTRAYGEQCDMGRLMEADTVVTITRPVTMDSIIALTRLYEFAARAYSLLSGERGNVTPAMFYRSYYKLYGTEPKAAPFGCSSLVSLITAVPDVLEIKGRKPNRKYIRVNPELSSLGISLPFSLPLYSHDSSGSASGDSPHLKLSQNARNSNAELKYSQPNNYVAQQKPSATNYMQNNGYFTQVNAHSSNARSKPALPNEYSNNSNFSNITIMSQSGNVYNTFSAANANDANNYERGTVNKIGYNNDLPKQQFNVDTNMWNIDQNKQQELSAKNIENLTSQASSLQNILQNMSIGDLLNYSVSNKGVPVESDSVANVAVQNNNVFMQNLLRATQSPPKPDSPPSREFQVWGSSVWGPLSEPYSPGLILQINLPPSSSTMEIANNLTSPTRTLIPAEANPLAFRSPLNNTAIVSPTTLQHVISPPPSQVPKPHPSLVSPMKISEQTDMNLSQGSGSSTPSKQTRKTRLAALFATPIKR